MAAFFCDFKYSSSRIARLWLGSHHFLFSQARQGSTDPGFVDEHYLLQSCHPGRAQPVQYHQRSEEHTSELQSLMRISYAVFCLKNKMKKKKENDDRE